MTDRQALRLQPGDRVRHQGGWEASVTHSPIVCWDASVCVRIHKDGDAAGFTELFSPDYLARAHRSDGWCIFRRGMAALKEHR